MEAKEEKDLLNNRGIPQFLLIPQWNSMRFVSGPPLDLFFFVGPQVAQIIEPRNLRLNAEFV